MAALYRLPDSSRVERPMTLGCVGPGHGGHIPVSMRINTNIEALNAQRHLAATSASFAGSVEKLSSGLRINRAADDAAGLGISEKLGAQVAGLN